LDASHRWGNGHVSIAVVEEPFQGTELVDCIRELLDRQPAGRSFTVGASSPGAPAAAAQAWPQ
jgi:hypothetical protein